MRCRYHRFSFAPSELVFFLAAMTDGKNRTLEFGVSDEQAWAVGLACGGRRLLGDS